MPDRNEAGKLFVGGLSWDTNKDSLLAYFSQYGEVTDCVVMKNQLTGKSRGFGFVTFRDISCVQTVLSVPTHVVDGRQVDPKACNPKSVGRGPEDGSRVVQVSGRGGNRQVGNDPFKDKKVFVGGLPGRVDVDLLKNFFGRYGKVLDVTIMYDSEKQRNRGFGFLTFEKEESVARVCREHYIDLNGKKVECKPAQPRDRRGDGHDRHDGPPFNVGSPPPGGPDGNWHPQDWNQSPQSPPHMNPPPGFPGAPPFQGGGFQEPGGYQQPGWQQPPQQQGQGPPPPQGAWPPNTGAPPQQPPPATAAFAGPPPVSQGYSSPPGQPPALAPGYQWSTSPPGPGQPPIGQSPQAAAVPGPPAGYQGYTPPVGQPQTPGSVPPPRMYGDFSNGAQQPLPAVPGQPAAMGSAPQPYAAPYSSPYGAPPPQGVGAAPPDVYCQSPATQPQTAPLQAPPVVAPTQPAYGSPVPPGPVAPPVDPAGAQPKHEYSYYAYPGGDASAGAAYGGPPPTQPPFNQGEAPSGAYGGAPGPAPSFQRQSSGAQPYHPYRR